MVWKPMMPVVPDVLVLELLVEFPVEVFEFEPVLEA
jgi:hypothetical protein